MTPPLGTADDALPGDPVDTLGELLVRRTARDRRLGWKRLGLAASGTFTLAAAVTVVTGSALRPPTPEPVAQPRPEAGVAPDATVGSGSAAPTNPLVDSPIVAPEPAPAVSPAAQASRTDQGAPVSPAGPSADSGPSGPSSGDHHGDAHPDRSSDHRDSPTAGGRDDSGTWSPGADWFRAFGFDAGDVGRHDGRRGGGHYDGGHDGHRHGGGHGRR